MDYSRSRSPERKTLTKRITWFFWKTCRVQSVDAPEDVMLREKASPRGQTAPLHFWEVSEVVRLMEAERSGGCQGLGFGGNGELLFNRYKVSVA